MSRTIIVDGYNVVHGAEPYCTMAEESLDTARAALVEDVAAYLELGTTATIVFDAGKNVGSDGAAHHVAGVAVVFSAYGHDADETVASLVAERRSVGDEIVVVTSDQALQWTTMGARVTRRSSLEFARDLVDERRDRAEHPGSGGSRTTIDELVDASTREALERWARGDR